MDVGSDRYMLFLAADRIEMEKHHERWKIAEKNDFGKYTLYIYIIHNYTLNLAMSIHIIIIHFQIECI